MLDVAFKSDCVTNPLICSRVNSLCRPLLLQSYLSFYCFLSLSLFLSLFRSLFCFNWKFTLTKDAENIPKSELYLCNRMQNCNSNSKQSKRHRQRHNKRTTQRKLGRVRNVIRSDFDALRDDYVDFGALIGQNGAFSWHVNYSQR